MGKYGWEFWQEVMRETHIPLFWEKVLEQEEMTVKEEGRRGEGEENWKRRQKDGEEHWRKLEQNGKKENSIEQGRIWEKRQRTDEQENKKVEKEKAVGKVWHERDKEIEEKFDAAKRKKEIEEKGLEQRKMGEKQQRNDKEEEKAEEKAIGKVWYERGREIEGKFDTAKRKMEIEEKGLEQRNDEEEEKAEEKTIGKVWCERGREIEEKFDAAKRKKGIVEEKVLVQEEMGNIVEGRERKVSPEELLWKVMESEGAVRGVTKRKSVWKKEKKEFDEGVSEETRAIEQKRWEEQKKESREKQFGERESGEVETLLEAMAEKLLEKRSISRQVGKHSW